MTAQANAFEHLVALYEGAQPGLETRVLSSPWGTASARTVLPYTLEQADALLRVIEHSPLASVDLAREMPVLQHLGWVQDGRLALTRAMLLEQVGRRLYDTLFPRGPVRTALNVALSQARLARVPLAFHLHLDREAGQLARLPWELLHDGVGYLVQSGRLALARYVAFNAPNTRLQVEGPLRVLAVVSRPVDLPVLDDGAELEVLRRSLALLSGQGSLEVDVVAAPTWRRFVDALGSVPYHIVHFDGHGEFGRRCPACRQLAPPQDAVCLARKERGATCQGELSQASPQGFLAFERPDRTADWRSGENLAAALFRNPAVRLAVLSACRSGMVGQGPVFAGTAPALIGMGVPAVAAMQFQVPLYATVAFSEAFYSALAERRPLVDAMASARTQLDEDNWYRPALYLRGRNDARGALFERTG